MQNQEFDSVFKTKLESFEMPPDDASWDAINQQVSKNRWWKRTAYFSAVLLLLGLLSQFFNKEKVSEEKQLVDSIQTNPTLVSPPSEETTVKTSTTTDPIKNKPTTTSSSSGSTKGKEQETSPIVQTPTPITPAKDSISTTTTTAKTDTVAAPKVVVVKKKKPVYIIQQDTIVKTDTVQVRKREK